MLFILIRFTLIVFTLILGATGTLLAQEVHGNSNFWTLVMNRYTLSEKFKVGNEVHYRMDDFAADPQQLIIRPWVDYIKNKTVVYSAGYSYIETYPYGEYPLPQERLEHNFWEQVTLIHQEEKVKFLHRNRVEHRFQENFVLDSTNDQVEVNGFVFSHRYRYRLTLEIPIYRKYFAAVFNELWINISKDFQSVAFDRNWFYIGLGNHINEQFWVQIAFMQQYIQNNPNRFEQHPTLQITTFFDF